MPNIDIKVTADVTSMEAQFAVAKAQSSALTSELNKLARQAAQSGDNMSAELKAGLLQASEAAVKARANVSSLRTSMASADPSIFGERLSGLRHIMEGLEDPIRGVYSGVGKIGEVFAAAAGAYGLERFASDIEKGTAELQHQSEVLQLSVTSYQAFREAAIDSGVDVDSANEAILRFSKNISQAQEGTGLAAKDLVEMGVSANQSKEALLQQVAAFALHADAATRDRIAFDFFGRTGAEIIPLLQQWAQGADDLTQKYDAMGRIIHPGVTEAAEKADISLQGAWSHLRTEAAPAVVGATTKLSTLVKWLTEADEWSRKFSDSFNNVVYGMLGMSKVAPPEAMKPTKPVTHAVTEQDEVAALNAIDAKMRERIDLEKELAVAKKTAADASKAGDTKGLAQANEVISDLQKQLDSLNRQPGDYSTPGQKAISDAKTQIANLQANANPAAPAAEQSAAIEAVWRQLLNDHRLNAKEHAQVEQEMDRAIAQGHRAAGQEADQEARSDAQTQVALATQAFNEKKSLLDEEFAAHKITAQAKYQATVQALMEEAAAQKAAQQQIIDSDVTTVVQKHEAANQIVVINAQMNAQIAAAARQLTGDLKAEDQRRYESWKAVTSEIESAEGSLVSNIFSGRQTLTQSIAQLGLKLVQDEITNDLKALTEHEMVNMGILASDKATAQEGFLAKLLGIGQEEAADQTSQATKLATQAAGQAEQSAINVGQVQSAAAVAFANTFASISAIPIVGPAMAPAAAAGAMAEVEAVSPMAALAVGTNYVPRDMIAQIHEGEAVVPKAYNPAAGGSGLGGGGVSIHFNPEFHGIPQVDVMQELRANSRDFVLLIKRLARDGALSMGT